MATVGAMVWNIEARTASIEQSLAKVSTLLEDTHGSMLKSITISAALGTALERMGELAGEAFLKAADAIPELLKHVVDVGDSIYEMSLRTGASVETLSALRFIAGQTGMNFDSFNTILFKMEQALGATGKKADEMQKRQRATQQPVALGRLDRAQEADVARPELRLDQFFEVRLVLDDTGHS